MSHEPIIVWQFHKAPPELRALSTQGGDEDWLALVPPNMQFEDIPWLDDDGWGGRFGRSAVETHDLTDRPGYRVYIGAH